MSGSDLHEYAIETTERARGQEASSPGPLESLAECADPSGPHFERHFDLLGFADLSTQARSDYRELRPRGGYWNLNMRPRARAASLQQSTRLGLQPHEPRAGNVGGRVAAPLAVRVRIHAEWRCVRRRADRWGRLARLSAPQDRSVRRVEDVSVLHRISDGQTGAPPMATSQFQHKVQRAPARGIFYYSDRRVTFGNHGLGDSPAHAVPFAGCNLWRIRCNAGSAFLAHVGLHTLRSTSCDSGFR